MENNFDLSNRKSEISDYDCFVCFELMVEPSKLPCNHFLCLGCLNNVLLLKRNCPFCRSPVPESFNPVIDKVKETEIQTTHAELYEKRMEEIKIRRLAQDTLTLIYGNTHEIVHAPNSHNQHSWTAFVKLSDNTLDIKKYIKKVVFNLHPTFHRPVREVRKAPFQIGCLGWGVFLIPITVHWQGWLEMPPTELEHFLSFDGNGNHSTTQIKFEKSIFEEQE